MNKKLTAIIAVRKGSERVKDKNIRPFADTTLLENKIKQLIRTNCADEICVSSNCEKMLAVANDLGTRAIKREEKYATSYMPMNDVYKHLSSLASNEHILYVHVTSPLLLDQSLIQCVETYRSLEGDYDSLATVTHLEEYIWNDLGAVNYDPNHHPRSQDLPKWYCLNFAVNILPKKIMYNHKNIVGKRFYPYFLDEIESVDVDNIVDFQYAEFLYKKRIKKEKNI